MDSEIKADWLARLRSGDYVQGSGWLKRVDPGTGQVRHCPLGILCDLAVEAGVIVERLTDSEAGEVFVFGSNDDVASGAGSYALLPFEVLEWAGLKSPAVHFDLEGEEPVYVSPAGYQFRSLTGLNDAAFSGDFLEVADAIEAKLL